MDMKKLPLLKLAVLSLLFLAGGCASPSPDPNLFFDEWRARAETSQPLMKDQRKEAPTLLAEEERKKPATASREELLQAQLTTRPVSIRLVDVEIGAAMRSLCRLVDQNIIINPSVKGKVNIHATETPWNEVFMGFIRSYGLVAANEGGILRVMSVEDMKVQVERKALELEEEQVSPLVTGIVPVKFADPEDIAESVRLLLTTSRDGSPRGSVSVDRHTRSLVMRDVAGNIERLTAFVKELDQATPQILIEAHIVEANQDTARELGVQWGWFWRSQHTDNRTFEVTPADRPFGVNLPANAIGNVNPAAIGLIHAGSAANFLELQLSALQRAGKINILSRPSIITLDNNQAVIESGTQVPFQTVEDREVKVEYKDAVLRLMVTPHVITSDLVKLRIEAKKDEVDLTRNVLGNPFIIKKLAQTNLVVENGSTVVIAGLSRERNAKSRTGVPLLQDIPGLGRLFQSSSRSGEFEELLIFITPRVLVDN